MSTPAGPVPIGSLVESDAVGTKVYDAHGTTRIVATKANGVKEVLRLHTTSGHVLEATADHLVWRATDLETGEFTVAGFLRPGDHLLYVQPDVGGSDRMLLDISKVENLGPMEVYDIQTESGEYLSGNLRVHNCFILAVDDTMDSILEWYREEGLIFKGGSGRGRQPVPDPLEQGAAVLGRHRERPGFVHARRRRVGRDDQVGRCDPAGGEDGRARRRSPRHRGVHRDQGARGGEDPRPARRRLRHGPRRQGHHQRPVPERQQLGPRLGRVHARGGGGRPFDLAARTTGEPIEQVDAKELFGKMAKAAWECADPGIQYDGTINDWHTCPESGRITASNPCSEYVHLDNSSCNLASINLMKFLRDDDTFDVERFSSSPS